jgi:hypothetical protein
MGTPKKPEDHKAKSEKPKVVETDSGWRITHRGITLNVEREVLDDFELLDDLAELQRSESKGAVRVPSMLRRLAGPEGFRAVADGLRDPKTGRVAASEAVVYVFEVFQALNPNG